MKKYMQLFWAFAQIGVCMFGGGYAMLPLLQRSIVDKHHWATEDEIMDYYAIGQCTPGIIAVNTATFIGYYQAGIFGAIIATLGLLFPSVVIITVIAAFLQNFASIPAIIHAFAGIRVCVFVLIGTSVWNLGKKALINRFSVILFLIVTVLAVFTQIPTVLIVISCGLIGLIFCRDKEENKAKGEPQ